MCDYEAEERVCFRLSSCGMLLSAQHFSGLSVSHRCAVCALTVRATLLWGLCVSRHLHALIVTTVTRFLKGIDKCIDKSINRTEYLSKRRPARWKRAFATFSLMDFYNCSNQMWWKQSFPVHTNVVVIFPPDDAGVAGRSQSNCSSENIGARGQKYWAQDFGNSLKE